MSKWSLANICRFCRASSNYSFLNLPIPAIVYIYCLSFHCGYPIFKWIVDIAKTTGYQFHYNNVIVSAMVSQLTGASIIYSTSCSGADQRKHQSFASWLLSPVNSPHKGPITRNMFLFDDVIMFVSHAKMAAGETCCRKLDIFFLFQTMGGLSQNILQRKTYQTNRPSNQEGGTLSSSTLTLLKILITQIAMV